MPQPRCHPSARPGRRSRGLPGEADYGVVHHAVGGRSGGHREPARLLKHAGRRRRGDGGDPLAGRTGAAGTAGHGASAMGMGGRNQRRSSCWSSTVPPGSSPTGSTPYPACMHLPQLCGRSTGQASGRTASPRDSAAGVAASGLVAGNDPHRDHSRGRRRHDVLALSARDAPELAGFGGHRRQCSSRCADQRPDAGTLGSQPAHHLTACLDVTRVRSATGPTSGATRRGSGMARCCRLEP